MSDLITAMAAATLVSLVSLAPMQAAAAASSAGPSVKAGGEAVAKGKRHRAVTPKTDKGSSTESTAERDRRLKRECRGMPNAGACLGYTR